MDFSTLTIERQGAVEILSLNRPDALNAMSPEMVSEMRAYFDGLLARLDVRVVLLRAEGQMFSAGADLGSVAFAEAGEGRAQRQMAMQKWYSGLVRSMHTCPQPIIALLHGEVCGGGFSLALASDVRYAAPSVRMNAAYIRVGLGGCDMGAGYLLPRLIGLSNASEFLLTVASSAPSGPCAWASSAKSCPRTSFSKREWLWPQTCSRLRRWGCA